MKIPSNKTFLAGSELSYIGEVIASGNIGSDGRYTRACARLLEERYSIRKVLITPSCTAALEMAAMLCNLGRDDEVILPSFTFASTANAIVRLGAHPVFVDIRADTLNFDERLVEAAITPRTKAILPVHYAGVACEMDTIIEIAQAHNLFVIEDAAQGVNAFYKGRALGSLGTLGAYSFHSTKNFACGEGGALCINSEDLVARAEIIRDKGTNRGQFLRGEVDRYTWVDVGSSYLPSELVCAFLFGQLEMIEWSTKRRSRICRFYDEHLRPLAEEGLLRLPATPEYCESNHHLYYLLLPDAATRDRVLKHLNEQGIGAVTHYVPLHSSPIARKLGYGEAKLPVTEMVSECLLRLPVYPDMTETEQKYVIQGVHESLQKGVIHTTPHLAEAIG
ncbi:MAG: dTDP-4-amino-4,6-dideoxygalactose transaminase [Acidobacteriota bacterium]|nr:dTDP-4-amino-4,6-dideoxygalactose transaminase [Acidobacteriota bacterium]